MNIAVCHASPAIRRAIVDGLVAVGLVTSESPDDLVAWLGGNYPAGALLTLDHDSWADVRREFPDCLLVGLVDQDNLKMFDRAFAQEATSVIATCWQDARIVRAVLDAIDGFSMIPRDVAQAMASRGGYPPADLTLSRTEAGALRQLCEGVTVVAIAEHMASSEREMHRILSSLYDRMAVSGRSEAMVRAAQWGLADS